MRDHHFVKSGTKRYAEDFDEIIAKVKVAYPTACKEGSTGGWSWATNDGDQEVIVAEAWMHRTKSGWWYRIKRGNNDNATGTDCVGVSG